MDGGRAGELAKEETACEAFRVMQDPHLQKSGSETLLRKPPPLGTAQMAQLLGPYTSVGGIWAFGKTETDKMSGSNMRIGLEGVFHHRLDPDKGFLQAGPRNVSPITLLIPTFSSDKKS